MRLLVAGGSGFTGKRVVRRAVDAGHDVLALARSESSAATLRRLGARPVHGDLDSWAALRCSFLAAQADCLLNIASLGFGHAPAIIRAAEAAGIKRAVFVSTAAVTTRLPARSRAVRLAAEDAVRHSALDWTLVRPTMIYGAPGDRNMARLLALLRRTPIVPVPGGGHRLQQPVHVEDVAAAIIAAMDCPAAVGKNYNVAGPEPISFRCLLTEAAEAVGRRVRLVPVPLDACVAVLRLYETIAPRPRLKSEQLLRLAEDKAVDITEARTDLGFDPRSFTVGVREEARLLWP